MEKGSTLDKFSHERFYKWNETAHFPKEPAHTSLTILDRLPKKEKSTLKVCCMNSRMIQAVIKCFERSLVERIEENSNDLSRCLFIRTIM